MLTRTDEIRILTPTGMMGYGFPLPWFRKGLDLDPHVITVDAGSTDSGPQKLGIGAMTCTEEAYRREFEILLEAGQHKKIPVWISSAGGDGSNQHVDIFVGMVREIAKRKGYRLRVGVIYGEIDKELVRAKLKEGRVSPCGPVEDLKEEEIDAATVIVAQMGVEPWMRLLDEYGDLDVIISGRAYDPVPIALLGLRNGFDPGLSWHMGKVMECGAHCAEPWGRNIFGVLRPDHFVVEPLNPDEKCLTYSVAAHTLYEKSHPYILPGPGGHLDLSACRFEQLTDRSVKVSGSRFVPANPYTVKLEGARPDGFRAICIAGVRDPILISQYDSILAYIRKTIDEQFADQAGRFRLIFHSYGKNGVMGELEPEKDFVPLEIGIVIEVSAFSQELALTICNRARTTLHSAPYEGRIATAANAGIPFTPLEIPLGPVCKFTVYHLMQIDNPADLFPIRCVEI